MKIIGIRADYLTDRHREKILRAAGNKALVCFFDSDEALFSGVPASRPEGASASTAPLVTIDQCQALYGYFPLSSFKEARSLEWLHAASAGVDRYLDRGIFASPDRLTLTHANGSYGLTISEHVIMVLLMLMRRELDYVELMRQEVFQNAGPIRSICGSRFAVVGTGDVGTHIARRLKALGAAHIDGVRRTPAPADPAFDRVHTLASLPSLVSDLDALILCVPETNETRNLLSRDLLALLPSKALIVNVGRGSAIDQDALIEALNHEKIAGAALDVCTPEPLPKGHPLYKAKNILLTPHISGVMNLPKTCDLNVDIFCRNLLRFLKGEALHHVVDFSRQY